MLRGRYGHRMWLTDFGEKILAVAQLDAGQLGSEKAKGTAKTVGSHIR
ncbi:hypothetical protein [Streptomyces sp. NPDC054765]